MSEDVFPITIYCDRQKGWSDRSFRDAFMSVKPEALSWYGYDVVINSASEIEFVVFDMRDNFYGGVGKEISRLRAAAPRGPTKKAIEGRLYELASRRRAKELDAEEDRIIRGYMAEIRSQIGV